jgi:hypothetical protein
MGANSGAFKIDGGNPSLNVVVKDERCVIDVSDQTVLIDGSAMPHEEDVKPEVDGDLFNALSKMVDLKASHEEWIITNVSGARITLGFTNGGVLYPGESIDALMFASPDEINESPSIQGARRRGLITLDIVKKRD